MLNSVISLLKNIILPKSIINSVLKFWKYFLHIIRQSKLKENNYICLLKKIALFRSNIIFATGWIHEKLRSLHSNLLGYTYTRQIYIVQIHVCIPVHVLCLHRSQGSIQSAQCNIQRKSKFSFFWLFPRKSKWSFNKEM